MLSRVANSICWIARYMERTNGMLRLLRTNYISSQDEVTDFSWHSVLRLYSDLPSSKTEQIKNHSPKVLEHLILDLNNTASVCNNIYRSRENARAAQDHITKEVWQCLNDYHHLIRDQQIHNQIRYGEPLTAFDALIQHGMLYYGTVDSTMARGEGFNYLNVGKFLERAILSADMLNIKLAELNENPDKSADTIEWRYLLYSLSGYELYLKTYQGKFETKNVVEQVLYDSNFPHSVLYCLQQLTRYFERLKEESLSDSYAEVEFLIGKTTNHVKYSNIENAGEKAQQNFLQEVRKQLFQIANAFNQYYFGNT
jgi:uncharacterized alpha-E superfamily protein